GPRRAPRHVSASRRVPREIVHRARIAPVEPAPERVGPCSRTGAREPDVFEAELVRPRANPLREGDRHLGKILGERAAQLSGDLRLRLVARMADHDLHPLAGGPKRAALTLSRTELHEMHGA